MERVHKRPNPDSEAAIQRTIFQHLGTRGAPGIFAFHPRNGGRDQRGRAAGIHTGLGVVPGVPDVIVLKPTVNGGGFLTCQPYALELKTEKGKPSPEQLKAIERMRAAGAIADIANGLDDALRKLEDWGLLRGKAA